MPGAPPGEALGSLDFGVQFALFGCDLQKTAFDVVGYAISPTIDVAALVVTPEDDSASVNWPRVQLSAVYPEVGAEVNGVGFPKTKTRDAGTEAKVTIRPTTMPGRVTDVHYRRRDGYMLTFPCFCTDGRYLPGASGGPVFDEAGRVCGVICSGFDSDDSQENVSYASVVWPTLALTLDMVLGTQTGKVDPYTLKSLADRGTLTVYGLERIEVVKQYGVWHAQQLGVGI